MQSPLPAMPSPDPTIDLALIAQVAAALFAALAAGAAWLAASASRRQVNLQVGRERVRDLRRLHDLLMDLALIRMDTQTAEIGKLHRLQHRIRAELAVLKDLDLPECRAITELQPGGVPNLEGPAERARTEIQRALRADGG